jgi:hypothetical protein
LVGSLPDPHSLVPPWLGPILTVIVVILAIMVLDVCCQVQAHNSLMRP